MSLQSIFRRVRSRRGGRLLVLNYESVAVDKAYRPAATSPRSAGIALAEFRWQMGQIAARFEPTTLARLRGHIGGKNPLSGPQICVSFHSESVVELDAAFLVLRELNVPATLFTALERVRDTGSTGTEDGVRHLEWAAMREFAVAGLDIACRVCADSELAGLSPGPRRQQLSSLRLRAEQETGVRVQSCAYPGDGRSQSDKLLIYDAALAGYSLGVSGERGINSLMPIGPMTLRSFPVTSDLSRANFQSLLEQLRGRT